MKNDKDVMSDHKDNMMTIVIGKIFGYIIIVVGLILTVFILSTLFLE